MGSHSTLNQELAAEALELDPDDWTRPHAVAHLAIEQRMSRVPLNFGGGPDDH